MSEERDGENGGGWWRRPLLLLWLFLLIMTLQAAFASFQEYEPRAGLVFGGISFTLLLGGWIVRIIDKSELF
jgi:hypothetical protein